MPGNDKMQLAHQEESAESGDSTGSKKKQLEELEIADRTSPSGKVVYKAVLAEADEELSRSSAALFWSGLAAGLAMGLSMITEGLLRYHLPQTRWSPLIEKLGYGFGFIAVILGRQQLFTENTLTPILPLLKQKDVPTLLNVLRLWGVVLVSNLIGAFCIAGVAMHTPVFESGVRAEFILMGAQSMNHPFMTLLLRGIFAGWLVAMLVWMLPYAESSHFFLIMLVTWLIGIGRFSHVIAGAVDVFVLGWIGQANWLAIFGRFILPVLLGNIIGGVTLVAALNHAQVTTGESEQI